jgi:hypothetical protein
MPSRVIREGFLDSDAIAKAGEAAECFFIRLALRCDDYGRFDGRIPLIARACWPLGNGPTDIEVETRLEALVREGIVRRYVVDGKTFVQIEKFKQRLRSPRSKFPGPDGGQVTANSPAHDGQLPDNCPPQAEPVAESEAQAAAHNLAQMAALLEAEGMKCDDLAVNLLAKHGITVQRLADAIATARTRPNHPHPLHLGYLLPILTDRKTSRANGDDGRASAAAAHAKTQRLLREQRVAARLASEMPEAMRPSSRGRGGAVETQRRKP